jgi:hypothetical protein
MKLDSREKYDRIRKFLADIRCKPNIEPFLSLDEVTKYGIYDFCYINKNPSTFGKIEKKIKDQKYDEINEFVDDMRNVFISVSDFIFSDDPLQLICDSFKDEVDRFHFQFKEEFRNSYEENVRAKPKIEPKK